MLFPSNNGEIKAITKSAALLEKYEHCLKL